MFCTPDQSKRSRIEVGRHGMIFQHPAVNPLGSPGVPLQQLMPTAQGRNVAGGRQGLALVFYFLFYCLSFPMSGRKSSMSNQSYTAATLGKKNQPSR